MPPTPSADEAAAHQALLDSMDIAPRARPFRNPNWKPSQRRNKNVKQMIGEASRREQSAMATNANSGATTPARAMSQQVDAASSGVATPLSNLTTGGNTAGGAGGAGAIVNGSTTGTGAGGLGAGLGAATQSLDRLVLERNLQAAAAVTNAAVGGPGTGLLNANGNGNGAVGFGAPAVTYTNIEAAPSLTPAGKRPYCDVTGLPARYTDPKTRLRYHDREVFALIRTLPQGMPERYLEARAAHVVLK